MAYADEDLIPISALQHHLFCPRQCALIHVDGLWAENRLTAEGAVLHERSDSPGHRVKRAAVDADAEPLRGGAIRTRTVRGLPLLHRGLGLTGRADQVEFHLSPDGGLAAPPRPIEHKRGRPKRLDHDRVQVAAQAMCLEEMLGVPVPEGELFYNAVRRREAVSVNDDLRAKVEHITLAIRSNIERNHVPLAKREPKCKSCSLLFLCMPGGTAPRKDPERYLHRSLSESLADSASDPESAG